MVLFTRPKYKIWRDSMSIIGAYLNQKCKWYKKTGQDAFSKPIYAQPVDTDCQFEGGMKLIKDKTGKEVVSQGNFIVAEKIGLEDKLGYDGRDYTMLNYIDVYDLGGNFMYRQVWV
jgi:hypothetical protein